MASLGPLSSSFAIVSSNKAIGQGRNKHSKVSSNLNCLI